MFSRLAVFLPFLAASLAAPLHSTRAFSSAVESRGLAATIQLRDASDWLQARSFDEGSIPDAWERSVDDSANWQIDARDLDFGQSGWEIDARDLDFGQSGWEIEARDLDFGQSGWEIEARELEFDPSGWEIDARDLDFDQSSWEVDTRDLEWENTSELQARSKIGDKIKNFFKKVGGVFKKVGGVIKKVIGLRSVDEEAEDQLAARDIDLDEEGLQERSKIGDKIKNFFKKVGGVFKKVGGVIKNVIGLRSLEDEQGSVVEERDFEEVQGLEE